MEYSNQDFQTNTSASFQPTRSMRQDWHGTARWGNFLAIVWFVFAGIALIGTMTIGTALDTMQLPGGDDIFIEQILYYKTPLILVSIIVAGMYVALALFQYRFSKNMRQALQFTDQEALEASWLNFRNLFRWAGIFTIAIIVLYFGFVVAIGAAVAKASSGGL